MSILDRVGSPEDLKNLNIDELNDLAYEIRRFMIKNVSKTGGHLASNLGVVEITIALHKVFDTSKDRLVFDVGHQSYVHKILTGRKDGFSTLRQYGGLAGFPKPSESVHDAFIAGHASNSVSVALGMARARTLAGEDYDVIALLGDGAMTGGPAYEGLSDAGDSGEPIIIILNDNGMAIGSNVGGIAKYLAHERLKPGYMKFKRLYRRIMNATSIGRKLYNVIHKLKTAIKETLFHCSMFEEMGIEYLGPVDGHDISMMTYVLNLAREMKRPVLIHAITQKGKGYSYAENDPNTYHGVSPFDEETGVKPVKRVDFSSVFGDKMTELAGKDRRICAVTAAMTNSTGLYGFSKKYPQRFFDVGIAEAHATAMCAGLAKQGMIPVFAVYSTFLQRGYDMLVHDVGIGGLHVVFGIDRAGLVGADGETHHGLFDVSYLTGTPNFTVYAPSNYSELMDMLELAVFEETGPVAVRYPRGTEGVYKEAGTGTKTVREGDDFTIVTYGINVNTAIEAADALFKLGIKVEIIKPGRIWPLDIDAIISSIEKTERLLVLEECAAAGSIGEKLAAELEKRGILPKSVILKNTGNRFITHGDIQSLYKECGIDAYGVASAIWGELGNGKDQA